MTRVALTPVSSQADDEGSWSWMSTEPASGSGEAQPRVNSKFVSANGLRFHALTYGTGPPQVVVLPGITSTAASWDFVARRLAVIAGVHSLDLRGRGLSDQPATGYSLEHYAADVAGTVEALGLKRPILLGHSIGARIAVAAAALYPAACGPLLLVDPPTSGPGRPAYGISLEAFTSAVARARRGATLAEMRTEFPTWGDEHLETRRQWLPTCADAAIAESYEGLHHEDFFDYWRRLSNSPHHDEVLLLFGAETTALSAEDARTLAALNNNAHAVAVPAAGHMVPWDNLEGFMAQVTPFVTNHPTPQGARMS
jgi:N-formylmaleamate deformylase